MREIVLDIETTGFRFEEGHRVIEIGAVELMDRRPTGRHFHVYINPQREVPAENLQVHGLTDEFLKDKPVFSDIAAEMMEFFSDDDDVALVAHNAVFDITFINAELENTGRKPLNPARMVDTVLMARQKYPGQPANLDYLCRRFNIDLSGRTLHGGLLDARLLTEVYLNLLGEYSKDLLSTLSRGESKTLGAASQKTAKTPLPPRDIHGQPTQEELTAHQQFIEEIKGSLWLAQ